MFLLCLPRLWPAPLQSQHRNRFCSKSPKKPLEVVRIDSVLKCPLQQNPGLYESKISIKSTITAYQNCSLSFQIIQLTLNMYFVSFSLRSSDFPLTFIRKPQLKQFSRPRERVDEILKLGMFLQLFTKPLNEYLALFGETTTKHQMQQT